MATSLNNQANITYTYATTGVGSASSNVITTTLLDEYSMTATKISLTDTFRPGENLTYIFRIENNGTGPLYSVTVEDNLGGTDAEESVLSYVDESALLIVDGVYYEITPTVSEDALSFILPNPLLPNSVAFIVYMARTEETTLPIITETITNTATVTALGGSPSGPVISVDPDPSTTVTAEEYAEVSIYKDVDKRTVTTGESMTYTFTLTNTGNEQANGIVLTDELPMEFTVTSISVTRDGVTTTYDPSDYTLDPETNTLTLPSAGGPAINVSPATAAGPGITTITVTGTI